MLKFLRIRNLALLADVEIPFAAGLNVLTGETGAGKSILVDALGLALGDRAVAEQVRDGASRAVVDAVFRVDASEGVGALLQEAGIDPDPEGPDATAPPAGEADLIIRRELTPDGSRAFVNGCATTVATLRRVGARLFEVHGQHRHLSLLQPAAQRDLLDAYAGCADLLPQVAVAHATLAEARARMQKAQEGREDRAARQDALRLRLRDIDAVDPRPGEEEDLRREGALLRNAAGIAGLLDSARALLEEDGEASLVAGAARLAATLSELEQFLPEFAAGRADAETARLALHDLAAWLRRHTGEIDEDPERLETVETRLSDLAALRRRFGGDLEAVIEARDKMRAQLQEMEEEAADPAALVRRAEAAAAEYADVAGRLSAARRRHAPRLVRAVQAELAELAMEGTRIVIGLELEEQAASPVRVRGVPVRYDSHGVDQVELRFSANPGEAPRPVARTASGGELSRLMLALEGAARGRRPDAPRRLVFDEVDAGIGGRVAAIVGEKLQRLSATAQVICVTHLPQIASRADHHYAVEKVVTDGRTTTRVQRLDQSGRIAEVARMLGGTRITAATRRHAREMIGARD